MKTGGALPLRKLALFSAHWFGFQITLAGVSSQRNQPDLHYFPLKLTSSGSVASSDGGSRALFRIMTYLMAQKLNFSPSR